MKKKAAGAMALVAIATATGGKKELFNAEEKLRLKDLARGRSRVTAEEVAEEVE